MKNDKKLWKFLVKCGKINGINVYPFRSDSLKYTFDFKNICDVIVANRLDSNLEDCLDKVYTRDLYNKD